MINGPPTLYSQYRKTLSRIQRNVQEEGILGESDYIRLFSVPIDDKNFRFYGIKNEYGEIFFCASEGPSEVRTGNPLNIETLAKRLSYTGRQFPPISPEDLISQFLKNSMEPLIKHLEGRPRRRQQAEKILSTIEKALIA